MEVLLILIFVLIVTIVTSLYMFLDDGLWKNIEIYTPSWGEEYTIAVMVYLFIVFVALSWIYNVYNIRNPQLRSLSKTIYAVVLILFMFSLFCLTKGNTSPTESFILATIAISLLILNLGIAVMALNSSGKLFSIIPILIYIYIYVWIYEIKNNY